MKKEKGPNWDSPEARRLRALRRAEGFESSQSAFAAKMGWTQSEVSMFESGDRQVPASKKLVMHRKIPGFDPLWLTEGRKEGLSFDLRRRIEAAEAEEEASQQPPLAGTER